LGMYPIALANKLSNGAMSDFKILYDKTQKEKGVDSRCSIIMKYEDGLYANLHIGTDFRAGNTVLTGSNGSMHWGPHMHSPTHVCVRDPEHQLVNEMFAKPIDKKGKDFLHSNGELIVHEVEEIYNNLQNNLLQSRNWNHTEIFELSRIMELMAKEMNILYKDN